MIEAMAVLDLIFSLESGDAFIYASVESFFTPDEYS